MNKIDVEAAEKTPDGKIMHAVSRRSFPPGLPSRP
jgi:hypothetical protein